MTFENYRIITDGEKFRIQGYVKGKKDIDYLMHLSECYMGCDAFGYRSWGKPLEFNSKQECIDYIKTTYGSDGISKILKPWFPC